MQFSVNHPVLFLLAGVIVLAVLAQSVYFLLKAWRHGKEIGMPMDKLVALTRLEPSKVSALCMALRLKGRIRFLPGNRVALPRQA